jgi:hypothetical protein
MVGVNGAGALLLLKILLERGEIRLRRCEIARAQVLPQLRDGLRHRAGSLRATLRGSSVLLAGKQLLERGKLALGLRQIAGLEILTELLKPLLDLLKLVLTRGIISGKQVASRDSRYGHISLL